MLAIDLRGKRALVAGVADDGGYGFAIAKALAEAGATVCTGRVVPNGAGRVAVASGVCRPASTASRHEWARYPRLIAPMRRRSTRRLTILVAVGQANRAAKQP